MPTLIIDERRIEVAQGVKVIEAAEQLGIMIPRFCFHKALGSVGACRMCAVKFVDGPVRGIRMSCMEDVRDGMVVSTTDPEAVEFRQYVIEWLMLNHPHDCPVCDEGGHCLLQDTTVSGGHGLRRYQGKKRTYRDQYLGYLVGHEMNRCIHCYRCVRYYQEFSGYRDLGAFQIGSRVYFGRFSDGPLESPFAGNLIDICPTGVFTDLPSRYRVRRWDMERGPSVCIHCSLGCNTIAGARYREVLQNTQSIIIRMDTQGTITFFNRFALDFFDYTADEVIGKNVVGTIVAERGRSGHDLTMMANDLGFNAEGYAVNVNENVRRNGDRVWIAWINKAIRDEQGHIIEILCIGNDITDRKRTGEVRISTDTWKDIVVADTDVKEEVFDAVFHISTEISIEGREGKSVGTTFLIGDADNVMAKSRQISLNAFEGQKPESRMITNQDIKENIKEFAQLDGAFVIDGTGYIRAQSRYITVDTSNVTLPKGMGTRHNSVAAMTQVTTAVGIVVSQSGGGITIFKNGLILKKITL